MSGSQAKAVPTWVAKYNHNLISASMQQETYLIMHLIPPCLGARLQFPILELPCLDWSPSGLDACDSTAGSRQPVDFALIRDQHSLLTCSVELSRE